MGATNAHPVFVTLASKFKKDWDAAAKKRGLKDTSLTEAVEMGFTAKLALF